MSNRRKTKIERLEQISRNGRYPANVKARQKLQEISESGIDKVLSSIQKQKETK